MGIFSSKTKTTVGATVSRVIEDDKIVSSTKAGTIMGIFSEDEGQLVENIMESVVNGLGVRAERLYSYGRTKYTNGLPTAKVSTSVDGKALVWDTLKSLVNPSITEAYYHFGSLNTLHVGWVTLVNDYGYATATNQLAVLTAQVGSPVYLKDMVVVVNEATLAERENGSLDQWGTAAKAGYTPERTTASAATRSQVLPSPYRVDPLAVSDYVLVTYVWMAAGVLQESSFSIPLTGYDQEQDYFHIKYINGTQEGYWLYRRGAGTYPALDTLFDVTPGAFGEFFPITYFRYNKTSMGADTQSQEYLTSKRMLKKIGMDYLDIIDAIHENPDIDDVEQAMMMFTVPANTTNPMEQRYLFDLFSKLARAAGGGEVGVSWDTEATSTTEIGSTRLIDQVVSSILNKTTPRISIEIKDTKFSTVLSCEGIYKRKKAGVVAAVGAYASSFGTETITNTYVKREVIGTTGWGDFEQDVYGDVVHTNQVPLDVFSYKHQITSAIYEEVVVYDLKMTYNIFGSYTKVGDDLDALLLVPIDHAITCRYSIPDRELLYTRAMHYVFTSVVVTKVKWYQTSFFKFLMLVVAVVITIYSMGGASGIAASIASATASVSAFITAVAMGVVKYVIVGEIFKLFVKAVGAEIAMIIAFVAAAYGVFKAAQFGSLQGAPWANELLSLSSNLTSAVNNVVADSMKGLQKEAEQFSLLSKEKNNLLEKSNKLLEQDTMLSPFVIFGESPNEFYNRTVHSGNIGIVGIDSISSYVDVALTLPKLNDTLEGNEYA